MRHLIISGHKSEAIWAEIGQTKIWESKKQKLLGVVIDRQLNFDEYLISLCKKAGKKLSALARLANILCLEQRELLMISFIESQFGYCPLTWMFCGRKTSTRINNIHERTLRIVCRNNSLCFDQLLQIDKSYNIHHKNIQTLAIELYKVKNNLSNQIMQEVFEKHESVDYNLRFQTDFVLPGVNTTYFGLHSLRYLSSKIWNVISDEIKNSLSLDEFEFKIRQWESSGCHCKLCRSYIQHVGYLNIS